MAEIYMHLVRGREVSEDGSGESSSTSLAVLAGSDGSVLIMSARAWRHGVHGAGTHLFAYSF
jgi:hypothetical protein